MWPEIGASEPGRRFRVGIAGAGWVAGARHLPVLARRSDVDVVAIYDRDIGRGLALAERGTAKGVTPTAFTSLDCFLAEGLDVVHVTTSPWSHRDIGVAALESGAHVFTEKPMAMTSEEAHEMAAAALAADRLLCVSHNFLSSRSMQEARHRIGAVPVDYVGGLQLSAETRRLPTWYRTLPGGLMFDEIPHMLYTVGHLLGGELGVDHVRGTFDDDGAVRTAEVLLRGRTGSGQVTMVFCAPVSEWHVTASTSQRLVGIDLFRDIAVDLRPDGLHTSRDIARSSLAAVGGHVGGFVRAGTRWMTGRQYWGHDVLIGDFLDAIASGSCSPVPLSDALDVVEITTEILDALDLVRV
jgi:predicted dehydrogenase